MPLVSAKELRSLYTKVASIKPRLAGLDVGTMKVGVALSDPELSVAIPSLTLNRNECLTPFESNPLCSLLKKNKVFGLVVGFPYLIDGSESLQCEDVKFFVHSFWKKTGVNIPVVFHNELYTTQIAMEDYYGKRGKIWRKGLKKKDEVAAAVILQEFLDTF